MTVAIDPARAGNEALKEQVAWLARRWETAAEKRALRLSAQEKVTYLVEVFGLKRAAQLLRARQRAVNEWTLGQAKPERRERTDLVYRLTMMVALALGNDAATNFWGMRREELGGQCPTEVYWSSELAPLIPVVRRLLVSAAEEQLLGEESDEAVVMRMAEIRQRLRSATPGPWWVTEGMDDSCEDEEEQSIGVAVGEPGENTQIVVITPGCASGFDAVELVQSLPNATFIAAAPEDVAWLLCQVTRRVACAAGPA